MKSKNDTILYLVIPCYNEEGVLPITFSLFVEEVSKGIKSGLISNQSKILFIDDGSTDSTWSVIQRLSKIEPLICGIRQSRNRGHQSSLLAGLMEVKDKADIVISMDCDGQDDTSVIHEMIEKYYEGNDIVYGVRKSRETDTFFKRWTAQTYYKLLKCLGADVVYNHADYRLTSSRVLKELSSYKEVNLYLRGIFPLIGFRSTTVEYDRNARFAGTTHYPLKKMLQLAVDGITSLSIKPIRIITTIGTLVSCISFITIIWIIVNMIKGTNIQGWASTLGILSFISGIQLISLGVIGEYIGKIYLETKERPRYIISERTYSNEDNIDMEETGDGDN